MNLVSIIMPVYNSEKTITESIEGILCQIYDNWELLITDDGSNDKSLEIINKYSLSDERIKIFTQNNSGASIARNNSIKNASGRFIAFCDSDDIWVPKKLDFQIKFMIKNELSFTYSSYQKFKNKSDFGGIVKAPQKVTYESLLRIDSIGCLTAIYDCSILGKRYFKNIGTSEDYDLWLSIFKEIGFTYGICEVLAYYRISNNSISANKITAAKNHWKVLSNIDELSFFKRVYCFSFYAIFSISKYLK